MRSYRCGFFVMTMVCLSGLCGGASGRLQVVATLPDYAVVAEAVGGAHVQVETIVRGTQDAHFIRPKPSFVSLVARADVLISTGLDLEMWLPTVIDKSGNIRVRSGQHGYVGVAKGISLLEKPNSLSRAEGGVHVHGNPHITSSPLNMKNVAANITRGLIKNDAAQAALYQANLKRFCSEVDERLFGRALMATPAAGMLSRMAEKGTLMPFLEKQQYQGKPLITYLGGWLGKMQPLRGVKIVTYHKNWAYFTRLFGLQVVGTIEPKPGIPPSAKHVTGLISLMKREEVKLLLAANYFDKHKVRSVADRVGAAAVIVPLYVGGEPGVDDYGKLVDLWTDKLLAAAREKGVIEK